MYSTRCNEAGLPPSRRTLRDEVADRLRSGILGGRMAAGELLRENVLAASMGVSRGPIREALAILEQEGLVITRRNHSACVARLSQGDLEEVHSLRMALARLAVEQIVCHATQDRLAAMEQVVATMGERAAQNLTPQEATELDLRFHDELYLATGHRRLYEFWLQLRPQVHMLLLWHKVIDAGFRVQMEANHRAVLQALCDDDVERAWTRVREHLVRAYERVRLTYPRPAGGSNLAFGRRIDL